MLGNFDISERYSRGTNKLFDILEMFCLFINSLKKITSASMGIQRTWTARVGGRKPPTVESVTEPLDMHALRKPSSPSLSCSLREKLLHVFAAVSEEVATAGGTYNIDTQSGAFGIVRCFLTVPSVFHFPSTLCELELGLLFCIVENSSLLLLLTSVIFHGLAIVILSF